MPKVHANTSAAVHFAGGVVPVRVGQAFDADDPIVREHRHLFDFPEAEQKRGRRSRVEQATAAPGELRDL